MLGFLHPQIQGGEIGFVGLFGEIGVIRNFWVEV